MKFNKDSNIATFAFAIIMCVIVGGVLSVLAMSLKKNIKFNQEAKNKMNILSAINIESSRDNVEVEFAKYIDTAFVINSEGVIMEDLSNIEGALSIDVKKQYRDKTLSLEDKKFPLFKADKDGKKYYITPVVGTGLWGPIWGFVAFEDDGNTIYGASFDHKSETPGLGAEIRETFFEKQFKGKKILSDEGEFKSIEVVKGGIKDPSCQVDGITGGTITSDGVTDMLRNDLEIYSKYFNGLQ